MQTCELTPEQVASRNLDPEAGSCEGKKQNGDIVLNAVNDMSCDLKCAQGYYHTDYGDGVLFQCNPNSDKTSPEGDPAGLITCESS